jgi:hypothetical protein
MATEKFTCQQVIDVLKATRGMVYLAAESLGCSHVTVYNYIKRHPSIRLAWESFSGQVGDIAETRLFDAIERDESWAIAFYLKTKGKNRGYVERKEVSGKDGGKIQVETSFDGEQHAKSKPLSMESSTLEQLARSMKRSERLAIESILKAQSLWIPQNVPQWQAILSQADELYYGGQAGGGKTDLILGLAVTSHHRSLILRRESTQLRGIIERSREIIGGNGRLNEVLGIWRDLPDNRQIEMSGCKNESDKSKFQGRPHDLIAFDESVEFLESQVDFISAWACRILGIAS